MGSSPQLTVSDLRACFAQFNDDDLIENVWQDDEGQRLLKQVSLLVRREESRGGQASLSPRVRALKAIISSGEIDPPSDEDMLAWSAQHSSFWTISLNFDNKQKVDMVQEALGNRLRMISHLDCLNRSLRVRRRFLCLFFYDFAKMVHPTAERLGAATIRSVTAQLQLCGVKDVDTNQLKSCIAVGRRLDELARLVGIGAILCLPKEADEGTRLDTLGELVADLAQWLLNVGLEEWQQSYGANDLGSDARKLMIDTVMTGASGSVMTQNLSSVNSLNFMFVQQD